MLYCTLERNLKLGNHLSLIIWDKEFKGKYVPILTSISSQTVLFEYNVMP